MNILELFKGTGSVGKVCEDMGFNVISVDIVERYKPTHLCDIMDFDYKQYPRDYFSVVWGSPPCTNYSRLKNTWFGRKLKNGTIYSPEQLEIDMNDADKIVLKTFEIIDYFNPYRWFVENPATGRLKERDIMKDKKIFYDVDYCMYSDWGYKKTTRIWTNRTDFIPLRCDGKGNCGNIIEIKTNGAVHTGYKTPIKSATRLLHKTNLGDNNKCKEIKKQCKHKKDIHDFGSGTNRDMRYRIPQDLIFSLLFD
jgi:hypothetical protein